MIPEDSLYVRLLKWAYAHSAEGFFMEELLAAVARNNFEETWVNRFASGQIQGEPCLIFYVPQPDGRYRYFLTASGMGAAIDYLELQEAQTSGKNAAKLALRAIWIGVTVGFFQIILAGFALYQQIYGTQDVTLAGSCETIR